MTLTVNFDKETGAQTGYSSDSSAEGSLPPPLPVSVPPAVSGRPLQSPSADSYYLPSADEASELEDDGKAIKRVRVTSLHAVRETQSADRGEFASKSQGHVAHSLDSIPDDSGYGDAERGIMREKIAYLEAEIRKRDEQIGERKEAEVKAEALAKVKSQVRSRSTLKFCLRAKENVMFNRFINSV